MNSKISQRAGWRVILAGNMLFHVFSRFDDLPAVLALFGFCCFLAARTQRKTQNNG